MNLSYIGNASFITMTGDIYPAGGVVEAIQRHGVDGTMWRYLGSKGRAFKLRTVAFFATSALAQTARIDYSQTVGMDLWLVDPTGAEWAVYVEEAMPSMPKYVINSTFGAGYLVECEWTIRATGG